VGIIGCWPVFFDVSVRDDRSTTGWLLGTFGYDGNAKGTTPWKRMVPLGLQWGNSPKVTFAETCSDPNGPCNRKKLTEQWIDEKAAKDLATSPLSFNHLGYAGGWRAPSTTRKRPAWDATRQPASRPYRSCRSSQQMDRC
jgi:hypothetical protein